MKKLYFILMAATQALCGIFPIEQIHESESYLVDADKETLVLFDIDLTLSQPSEPAAQMPNIVRHKDVFKQLLESARPPTGDILTAVTTWSPHILIEEETPHVVARIAKRTIPMIAFTAACTSTKGWRHKDLKRLGYDFSQTFEKTELASPCFSNGVLICGDEAKGSVLIDFLRAMDLKYKKIIFIDDRENNLLSVQEALSQHYPQTTFVGLHYKGANNYPSKAVDKKEFRSVWKSIIASAEKN